MNVLLVTSLDSGGPLEHSLILARGLSRAGAKVTAVCVDSRTAERFEQNGAEPAVLPLSHLADVVSGARLRRLARRHDVVHAQDRRSGLWTRVWPRHPNQVRVYTVHGLPDPYLPPPVGSARRPSPRDAFAYRGVDAWLARRSDAVVTPSRFLADELRERLGFPSERMTVIPNGIEPAPIASHGDRVGTVSLLEPVKSLDTFIRAAGAVIDTRPSTRFAIFGDGSQRAELENLARSRRLDGAIEFHGHVPIGEALPQLSLYVLCSLLENCPMSLLEAMGAEVPALATDVGGIPEIAGATVPLVAPGNHEELANAIVRLLDDPELARANARGARERVEREFTADHNVERMLDLYERLRSERR